MAAMTAALYRLIRPYRGRIRFHAIPSSATGARQWHAHRAVGAERNDR